VVGLEFSPDGGLLASSDANGAAMLWDVSQQEAIARLAVGGPTTSGLAFSPDGRRLAAGSDNRVVTVWDLEVDTWLRLACSITQRNLTNDEWTRYLLNRPYRPSCQTPRAALP
jgi:WD40 repeat protein